MGTGGIETAEIRFLKAVTEYRITDHKRNENIREGLGKTYAKTI